MSYTIQNALIPVEQGYETVDVQIIEEKIAAIGSGLAVVGTPVDGRDKLLLPGFINAHTHSSEMWQRGLVPPYPLELWLAELGDYAPQNLEQVYLSALGTAAETLLTGGTSVVDHLTLIVDHEIETVEMAVKAYRESGIRAFVAPLIHDMSGPAGIPTGGKSFAVEPYPRTTQETLALLRQMIERFHRPTEGVSILVAPTGAQLCSDALFRGCIELSQEFGLSRHTHLLETKAQQMLAHERYGSSAVDYLHKLGFLNERTSLAHCVWLTDADIEILAQTGSTVVHNPLSNLRLGSGIAPLLKYRQAGVNVTFGCDGSASNDSQDLLEAVKIGSILHNITDFEYRRWISPRQAVEMASLGGARGLGWQAEMGSLTVGKQADLMLYDLRNLSLLPRTDPIGLLIWGRPAQVVESAWVRGKRVIAAGALQTIDVDSLRAKLFEHSSWDPSRKSETVAQIEARYRSVMGLPE